MQSNVYKEKTQKPFKQAQEHSEKASKRKGKGKGWTREETLKRSL